MKTPKLLNSEAIYTLPEPFETEIGRVVVRWAHLEDLLQWVILDLMQSNPAVVRIVVREPSLPIRLEMIDQLAVLTKFCLPKDWERIKKAITRVGDKRNHVAHGAWSSDENGSLFIENTRGSYMPESRSEKTFRRIEPTAIRADLPGLRSVSSEIEKLISRVRELHDSLLSTPITSP